MKTRERAENLALAAASFPFLGISEPEQLIETVRLELGHEQALDDLHRADRLLKSTPLTETQVMEELLLEPP